MDKEHTYSLTINWTGNLGTETSGYSSYNRSHTISIEGKENILCSSDPAFLGDHSKSNPEELFLASLSSCHMLLHHNANKQCFIANSFNFSVKHISICLADAEI